MKKIYSLLVMMLLGYAAATADTSTLTFTKACGGSGTADDGAVWTVTSDGAESQYDGTRGIHYGTNKAAVTDITLTTSDIKGTITEVKVNATAASSANLSVTVGGAAFGGDAQAVSTTPDDYTFTGSASGEIVVTLAKPQSATKALYVKSIEVTYSTGGETPEPATKYAVNISEMTNGSVTANLTEAAEGATVTLTVTPDQGYMLETLTVVDAEQTEITVTDNKFTMPASDVTVSATFVEKPASEGDILNYDVIGVQGSTYSEWTGIEGASGAVYAGNSAGSNNSIQLRSNNNNSGIVSTTSGGKVKSVKITFNSNTIDARTVDVYGSNTAYTAATDLYGDNAGTKLGSATKSDGAEQTITVTGDYAYVGIRSASGAIYLDEVAIVWEAGYTPEPATKYAVNISETTNGSVTADPTEAEEGATVTLTVTPDAGYELETLTVVDAEQTEITVTNNEFTMPASDVTVSATFVEETTPTPTPGGDYEWVSTAATGLATGDVVVIAETTALHALANDGGTSAAPVATAITLNADDATKLAAEPAANLQWTVTVTDNGYQFAKDDTNYLYCTSANNGVRVGTNENNVFTISDEGYLVNSATSRYIGVYNNQDWRCYTSINNNIKEQAFTFFKKTAVQEEPTGVSLEEALAGNGGEGVTISNELTVVRVYNGYVYATDGNDNWVRLDGIENADALTPGYVLTGNQVPANVQNATLAPAVAVNAELTGAEGTEPELEELDLANAPEALPKAGKVMKVTGYYLVIDNEPVFAAYGDKDQAEGHCIGLADAGTMLVGSGYDLEIFVELVEPWNNEEAAGAPRRLTAVDGAALRNIKATMVADPEFATGVNSIAADGNAVSVKYVSVTGQVSNRPFEGMNIVVKTYSDGTTKAEKMIR